MSAQPGAGGVPPPEGGPPAHSCRPGGTSQALRHWGRHDCPRIARAAYGTPPARTPTTLDSLGTVDKKNALRAGALAAGTTLMMLLMSSPALALTRDDGDDPGTGLSVIETLGLYVVAPIALFVIIAALVMVGDKSHKKKDTTSSNISTKAEAKA